MRYSKCRESVFPAVCVEVFGPRLLHISVHQTVYSSIQSQMICVKISVHIKLVGIRVSASVIVALAASSLGKTRQSASVKVVIADY